MKFNKEHFYQFCSQLKIESKEKGLIPLVPNGCQRKYVDEIEQGLSEGIHDFKFLKGRQLGISTISLALDLYWNFRHKALQGTLVTHNDAARDFFRATLGAYMTYLPKEYKVPVKAHNRTQLIFKNNSRFVYQVAGTRSSSDLGRSTASSFAHCTEVAFWGDEEGLKSFEATLADNNPDRLYIWETTANGFNHWKDMWDTAKRSITQRAVFIGWWLNEQYRAEKGSEIYEAYWDGTLDAEESIWVANVMRMYKFEIQPEQIAWWRWRLEEKMNGDAVMMMQEFPPTEDDAFVLSGSQFFTSSRLTKAYRYSQDYEQTFNSYRFSMGEQFDETELRPTTALNAELKIWQMPKKGAYYVLGADPAYGSSDWADRFAIQILRCYADGVEQVAEYATDSCNCYQFAWIIAYLAGAYGNCMVNLEINGPGQAVWNEILNLKRQAGMNAGGMGKGIQDVIGNIRSYLYRRTDGLGVGGLAYHWKALALDTLIPTPNGWMTMIDAKVGDVVFDENGNQCNVIGVSNIKTNIDCYRIGFPDGTFIVAESDHVWAVDERKPKTSIITRKLVKTKDLNEGDRIPVALPLKTDEVTLPIPPYVLGVWLGDGESASGRICGTEDDLNDILENVKQLGFEIGKVSKDKRNNTNYATILGLRGLLVESGLLNNKHIPDVYLRASEEQRLSLIQGLMDTDGSISGYRQCSFTTTSDLLFEGFSELLRSVGIKVRYCLTSGKKFNHSVAYQFYFTVYHDKRFFRIKRKFDRQFEDVKKKRNTVNAHLITSIEKVDSVPVKCIAVDSSSNLFLAGKGMIPTHNTTYDTKARMMHFMKDTFERENLKIRSLDCLDEMKSIVQKDGSIEAAGKGKDDRAIAMALAAIAWGEYIRYELIQAGHTFAVAKRRDEVGAVEQTQVGNMVMNYLKHMGIKDVNSKSR